MARITKAQQAEVDRILKLTNTKGGLKTLLNRPWDGPDVLRLTAAQWEPIRVKLESVPYSSPWQYSSSTYFYNDKKYVPNLWSMSGDLVFMRREAELIAHLIKQTVRNYERFEKKAAAEGKKTWEYSKRPARMEFKVFQKSVSRSGMYRHLKISVMTKDGLEDITRGTALILGWKYHEDDCIGVGGCGMDMHFHTVYSLVETIKYAMLPKLFDDGNWCAFSQRSVYRYSSY